MVRRVAVCTVNVHGGVKALQAATMVVNSGTILGMGSASAIDLRGISGRGAS